MMVITAGSYYQPAVMSLYSIKPQPLLPPTSLLLQPDGHTSLFHCCGRILPKFSRNLAILDVLTLPTCSEVSSHQLIGFVPIFFITLAFRDELIIESFFLHFRTICHHGGSFFCCVSAPTCARLVASNPLYKTHHDSWLALLS